MIFVEALNNALTSYIRLSNYVNLNSNVAHLQNLANQLVLNDALVIEKCLNNSFSESKSKFLVSEYIFKLVNHCEGSR